MRVTPNAQLGCLALSGFMCAIGAYCLRPGAYRLSCTTAADKSLVCSKEDKSFGETIVEWLGRLCIVGCGLSIFGFIKVWQKRAAVLAMRAAHPNTLADFEDHLHHQKKSPHNEYTLLKDLDSEPEDEDDVESMIHTPRSFHIPAGNKRMSAPQPFGMRNNRPYAGMMNHTRSARF